MHLLDPRLGHPCRSQQRPRNLLWQQDPLGRETQYQYDPEGRVT
ncbi:RHS repeat domain-containing protein [Pseudomonas sp. TYF_14]